MSEVILTRISGDDKQTLGTLSAVGADGKPFTCKTLELGWKNNAGQVSCIPKGNYPCEYTRSTRMSERDHKDVYTYEVKGVNGRGGIRIHSANYYHDLLGCIALGEAHIDIDHDGKKDVTNSKATIAAFEKAMNKGAFTLVIKGTY